MGPTSTKLACWALRTYTPWGVRVVSLTKSIKKNTHLCDPKYITAFVGRATLDGLPRTVQSRLYMGYFTGNNRQNYQGKWAEKSW